MLAEVVGEREAEARAVEAFRGALAHRDGHGDRGFCGEIEEGADLIGVEALHGAAVEAGGFDGEHELGGGQGHAFVDPRVARLGRHAGDVGGHLISVIAGGALVAGHLEVGDHGGTPSFKEVGAADQEDQLGRGGGSGLRQAGLDGLGALRGAGADPVEFPGLQVVGARREVGRAEGGAHHLFRHRGVREAAHAAAGVSEGLEGLGAFPG